MARVRPARRCSARRTNGEPCRCCAIVGGTVCRVHGGAATQVRRAAVRRVILDQINRGLVAGHARICRCCGLASGGYDLRYGPRP